MGLLTAALVIGAGAAAMGAVDARKQGKAQQAAMARQETAAREANRIDQTRPDGGADIVLGTDEDKGGSRKTNSKRKSTTNTDSPTTVKPPSAGEASFKMFGQGKNAQDKREGR